MTCRFEKCYFKLTINLYHFIDYDTLRLVHLECMIAVHVRFNENLLFNLHVNVLRLLFFYRVTLSFCSFLLYIHVHVYVLESMCSAGSQEDWERAIQVSRNAILLYSTCTYMYLVAYRCIHLKLDPFDFIDYEVLLIFKLEVLWHLSQTCK